MPQTPDARRTPTALQSLDPTGLRALGTSPVAHADAVVQGDRWRITVLTDGLVRIERAEDGVFEDARRRSRSTARCPSRTTASSRRTRTSRSSPTACTSSTTAAP